MKRTIFLHTIILLCATASIAQTYCASNSFSYAEGYIGSVVLGSINNQTTGSCYSNYTSLSTNLNISANPTITLNSGPIGIHTTVRFAVYIDYNHNGSFSDLGERIVYDTLSKAGVSRSFVFTPPSTALYGTTRMRVQMRAALWGSLNSLAHDPISSPCGVLDEGEVEDYTVNFLDDYCYSHGNTSAEYVNNVIFGTINKTSGNNGGYANFTLLSTDATEGYTYPISLTPGFTGSAHTEYWKVYIDLNNNKSFSDPGELVAMLQGSGTVLGNIRFSLGNKTGKVRMRVQMSPGTYAVTPCDVLAHGEVEDYTVNILPPVIGMLNNNSDNIASVKPNPATANNATLTYTLNKAGTINVLLSDISGSSQKIFNAGNKTAGTYTMPLNKIQSLRAGNYVLAIEENGNIIARASFIISE